MRKNINQFVLFILLVCQSTFANENNKLIQIKQQIIHLQSSIGIQHHQESNLQNALKDTETAIGSLTTKLQKNQRQQTQQQGILNELNKQRRLYTDQVNTQQEDLQKQIRAAYMLGHTQYLKMLLNQENPATLGRTMVYYHYFMQSRLKMIQQLEATLQQLQKNTKQIQNHTIELTRVEKQLEHEHMHLEQQKNKRDQVLQAIHNEIQSKTSELQELYASKHALERVIIEMKTNSRKYYAPNAPFAKLHGKLIWPTRGRLLVHFGSSIEGSEIKWNGVLIGAPIGQNVYAVAAGRVIFAKWLEGYGLLLIIDHGDGYMTLYGRNNSLYKQVGDTVNAGEFIATVGQSGGHEQSALYFDIRHNGAPINPTDWCNKRV